MVPPPRDVAPGRRHLPGRGERRFTCQFVGINDDVDHLTGRVVDELTGLDWGFTGNLTDGFTDGFTGEALDRFTGDFTGEVRAPPLDRPPRVLR